MIAGMSFSAGKIVVRMWNVLQKKNRNDHYKIEKKYFRKVALHSSHIINAMSFQHVTQRYRLSTNYSTSKRKLISW